MFSLFIKGLIIGVIVSAPIGPIGVLCAQRTLNKGGFSGFATALGATISDLLYAVIAVFSMSYVIDFIKEHEFGLRLIACFIIFGYGFYTYIDNPAGKLKKIKPTQDYIQDCLSSFVLTITNPLVILLFIALFAKFNYLDDSLGSPMITNVLAIVFIMLGAIIWWAALISIVNHFRGRFNIRGMWVLNKVTGIILMVLSVVVFLFWIIF